MSDIEAQKSAPPPKHDRNPNETTDMDHYKALMRGSEHRVMRFYQQNGVVLFKPLSSNMDTPFHVAAFYGNTRLLRTLLRLAAVYHLEDFKDISEIVCGIKNNYGNNLLHDVAATGKVKVFELLARKIELSSEKISGDGKVEIRAFLEKDQIKTMIGEKNNDGETPIFKASALAGDKMLREMIKQLNHPDDIYSYHLFNKNKKRTILQMAIIGQHFDSAIWLLKENKYLDGVEIVKPDEDMDCLRLLATMPQAFKSGYNMGIWHTLIYFFLPVDIMDSAYQWRGYILWVYYLLWLCIGRVIKPVNKVWKKKTTHCEAMKVLKHILHLGKSWKSAFNPPAPVPVNRSLDRPVPIVGNNDDRKNPPSVDKQDDDSKNPRKMEDKMVLDKNKLNPLLLAASNGITEIVNSVLYCHPIAVENSDDGGWNLLHVAVAFRRAAVFSVLTEKWKLPVKKLAAMVVEEYGYTVLHQAGDTCGCFHSEMGLQFGPALQLQEELRWYEEVEKITPPTLRLNVETISGLTARELFAKEHATLHESAKQWIKETSSSCSTVAILVTGAAFAGACTVPGDYNDTGYPNLRDATLYKIFTVADVVALISSLVSVVVFLSILTSPLPMRSYRHSLAKKVVCGIAALFVSVAATMLAFMAAVTLVIGQKHGYFKKADAYAVTFLPVAVIGIVQFPAVYVYERWIKPTAVNAVKRLQKLWVDAVTFPTLFQEFVATAPEIVTDGIKKIH